ncbi:hypothetical protein EXIGLDRAFT_421162 [Exidia glandulosa HHB12029]|uniref:Secreted protein n=1 Tax=Exidia glandulosa HHB12029 TaxID=1314781 RepID=A0A165KME0_EXIGL|nr:hypothetical protein EXIGLDRAFT_421162 [Exidia glandulosa HHB12029]
MERATTRRDRWLAKFVIRTIVTLTVVAPCLQPGGSCAMNLVDLELRYLTATYVCARHSCACIPLQRLTTGLEARCPRQSESTGVRVAALRHTKVATHATRSSCFAKPRLRLSFLESP